MREGIDYVKELYDFDKPVIDPTYMLGRRYSPSEWVSAEPEIIPVIRVKMTCGGGLGGAGWFEYIKEIDGEPLTLEALASLTGHIIVETYTDGRKMLNMNNMVYAKVFNIVSGFFYSDNPNFEKGLYKTSIITEPDTKVTLS